MCFKQRYTDIRVIPINSFRRNPLAPFTTSTLQQTASGRFGFGASRTMQIAQRLYQGALDTESEHYVQLALSELTRDRTTIVIAHRRRAARAPLDSDLWIWAYPRVWFFIPIQRYATVCRRPSFLFAAGFQCWRRAGPAIYSASSHPAIEPAFLSVRA